MKAGVVDVSRSRERVRSSGIYLVTDTVLCGPRGVVETVRAAVAGGVETIQVREKNASAADFYALVLAVAEAAGDRATVLVDDRVDIYLAARAVRAGVHGVHVGQSDLPAELVRTLVGPDAVVGLTANTAEHLEALAALPPGTVDYLGTGVIRPTRTKANHPKPLGISGFTEFAARATLPVVAIGGIVREDVGALRAAGATGAAVVSAICAAADPQAAAAELVRAWHAGSPA
ncbi:thiamine phosphate synthase [Arthrobacter sp. NPDC097144]|uniref:thiamine phosphate synthase n=1 Tax=Arthrobacter sp. NPDC097144 TaxID=3363946 RepID=UPI0038248C2C